MIIATEYRLGASRWYPLMQLNLKENIQNLTVGKIYVKLAPAGQLGTGSVLAQKVQSGTIQAAQHSMSNFSPYAPAVDLVNIPYRSEEHTSELQSLMHISYAVFCLKKKKKTNKKNTDKHSRSQYPTKNNN